MLPVFHPTRSRRICFTAWLVVFMLLFTSCIKNVRYSPLDGFWQVCSVEDKRTGDVTDAEGRLYISFECELAKLSYLPEGHNTGFLGYEYVGSFEQTDDSLHFGTFYVYRDEKTPAPPPHLKAFGIHAQPVSFALKLTRSTMTLDNAETRLTLRKY